MRTDRESSAAKGQRALYITPLLACHGSAQALTLFDVSTNMNDMSAAPNAKT
jgi:hypothetical protein